MLRSRLFGNHPRFNPGTYHGEYRESECADDSTKTITLV